MSSDRSPRRPACRKVFFREAICLALAEEMARDKRVTYRRHEVNLGNVATYNEGFAWAEADYMLILSADDILTSGALARGTGFMAAYPEVGLTFGTAIVTDDPRSQPFVAPAEYRAQIIPSAQWVESFCAKGTNVVGNQSSFALMRTNLTRKQRCGYHPDLPHAGDMEMAR